MIGRLVPAPGWIAEAMPWAAATRVRVLGAHAGQPHVVLVPPLKRHGCTVAKHYVDQAGARAAAAMRNIRTSLARLDRPPLAIPGAGPWHAGPKVLEQSFAPGRPLLPMLRSESWRQGATAAARALACLHALPGPRRRVTSLADHLRDLVHPDASVTAALLPMLAPRILTVATRIRTHRWRVPPAACIVHRDAHARQMTFDGTAVWMVDWDFCVVGDAALDVANFAVYVHTHVSRRGQAAREAFLDAYGALAPEPMPRLPVYTALTYLRLVSKACRLRRPGWRQRVVLYLSRAEAALDLSAGHGA